MDDDLPRPGPPREWLDEVTAAAQRALAGAELSGPLAGPGWIQLRAGGDALWIVANGRLRLAWVDPERLPRDWLLLLGQHRESPFAPHLRGATVDGSAVLATAQGQADGLELRLGGLRLRARFWPRPGALWLEDADGEPLARQGRMEGPGLEPRPPAGSPAGPDHAARCRAALRAELLARARQRLVSRRRRALEKEERLLEGLRREATRTPPAGELRQQADLLAAHQHALRPGQDRVELIGFDGEAVRLELDPALRPHQNVARLYHAAARAERKHAALAEREARSQRQLPALRSALERARATSSLEELAAECGDEGLAALAPPPDRAERRPGGRAAPARKPYWSWRLPSGRELRVGRNARDNDALTLHHAHLRDLWLHAQGVPGSHVVLRCAGQPVPPAEVELAARVAAHYSQARHSGTVAVLVAERRHVRKRRKSPPGQVQVERAKTLFVEPGMPECLERDDPA